MGNFLRQKWVFLLCHSQSQFCFQLFMELRYFSDHFLSRAPSLLRLSLPLLHGRSFSDLLQMAYGLYQPHISKYSVPDGRYNAGILSWERRLWLLLLCRSDRPCRSLGYLLLHDSSTHLGHSASILNFHCPLSGSWKLPFSLQTDPRDHICSQFTDGSIIPDGIVDGVYVEYRLYLR